ncbi:MAG: RNA polymerase subunit sigma-24 [Verrucomicrobia bacterium]|nr:MAG: RNA polymerase subunit sigma-24 [Verrucomicrobiota bacterium]
MAASGQSTVAREALETLCRTYWPPIYAFVRREGHSPHDAEDLTQGFFQRFLEKNYLGAVDRSKGRFRSYLLASLKHFLANEWDKARAQKRGGGQVLVPLDTAALETKWHGEPADNLTAERLFDRRWALTLLERVLARLREEHVRDGKSKLFEELKATLTGERSSIPYARIGQGMKMNEGAVKVAVHRLRQRYRELIRAEIAATVATPAEVEDEMRSLFAALNSR